jgi:prolyl oligopeptidase
MKDVTHLNEDPYRWLEDSASPRVQEWLGVQAEVAETYFAATPLRQALKDEFSTLFATTAVGMPVGRNGLYFFTKRAPHEEMPVLYIQEGLHGQPRVLIDPVTLSPDKTAILVGWYPSRDGKRLAYEVSQAGNDQNDIRIMDVTSGMNLLDYISDETYPCFEWWSNDGNGFWYTKRDHRVVLENPTLEAKLYSRLYYHVLGTSPMSDVLVFGEGFERDNRISAITSDDGRYLKVDVYGQDAVSQKRWNEIYVCDMLHESRDFVKVVNRNPGYENTARMHRGVLYIISNDGAPRFQVLSAPIDALLLGQAQPTICVAEGSGTIEDLVLIADALFIGTLENVHSVVRRYDLTGRFEVEIPLPTLGSVTGFTGQREGHEVFFSFQSFAVPNSVYHLDVVTGKVTLFAQTGAGFDTSQIETKQLWCTSKDGTQVPMFVVYKRGLELTGDNPTMLYGYGGFDVSLKPSFMKTIIPFLRRGGVYVIANLRGGGEFGREWHEAGMQYKKQNVFDDFAAAAQFLIASGYTRKERLAIQGGSNGGLLTMATITQHPELVQAAVAAVPVTDMLRYHLFYGGLFWIPDYGDPDDLAMRAYLKGYSPYHAVREGLEYPAVLITTSDSDDRVHPMHSYKMAARLTEANTSKYPIILRVEKKAGHGGASAVSKLIATQADLWAFVCKELGVTE